MSDASRAIQQLDLMINAFTKRKEFGQIPMDHDYDGFDEIDDWMNFRGKRDHILKVQPFDMNTISYLPPEKVLLPKFKIWMNLENPSQAKQIRLRNEIHCLILEQHPFVTKSQQPTIYDYANHKFVIINFKLNIKAFAAWCLKNKKWDIINKAGGNTATEDGLYTVSEILRKVLPRAFHVIYVLDLKSKNSMSRNYYIGTPNVKDKHKKKIIITQNGVKERQCFDDIIFFRGLPKFAGISECDGYEKSSSWKHPESFFFQKCTMKDIKSFVNTTHSNGVNCKLSILSFNNNKIDKFGGYNVNNVYAISGTRDSCEIWPICHSSLKYFPTNINSTSSWIANVYSNWLLRLQENKILFNKYLYSMTQNLITVIGNIHEPWVKSLTPMNKLFIETYCIIDSSSKDGLPIPCKKSFKFFQKFNMTEDYYTTNKENILNNNLEIENISNNDVNKLFTNVSCIKQVKYSIHHEKELDSVIRDVRADSKLEGAVLYLLDKHNLVIGLCKVKRSASVSPKLVDESGV